VLARNIILWLAPRALFHVKHAPAGRGSFHVERYGLSNTANLRDWPARMPGTVTQ
jgi:hypothetical protein